MRRAKLTGRRLCGGCNRGATPVAVTGNLAATHAFSDDAAMSGQRRAARLKTGARPLRNGKLGAGYRLEHDLGEVDREYRRGGGKSGSQCRSRHADRAEIVGMAVVFVGLPAALFGERVVGERRQQHAGIDSAAAKTFQMDVAERQGEINRDRKQCERCGLPDFGAKPMHSKTSGSDRARKPKVAHDIEFDEAVNCGGAAVVQHRSWHNPVRSYTKHVDDVQLRRDFDGDRM